MKNGGTLIIIAIVGAALWMWSQSKAKAVAPVPPPILPPAIYPTPTIASQALVIATQQATVDTAQTGVEHFVAATADRGYFSATWAEMLEAYGPL